MKTKTTLFSVISFMLLFSLNLKSQVNLNDSLILYYSFDKADLYGNLVNTIDTTNKFGKSDSSLYFSGNSNINLNDTIDLNSSDFSISVWFYADSILGGSGSKILNKGLTTFGTPNNAGFGLRLQRVQNINYLKFMIHGTSGSFIFAQDPNISMKTWNNVCVTKKGLIISLYVNGALKEAKTLATNVNTTSNIPLSIGALDRGVFGNIDEYFYGFIDELRIYNRALNSAEIEQLQYNFENDEFLVNVIENNENELFLNVYPNPANESIRLSEISEKDLIEIYSYDGKLVLKSRGGQNSINILNLSPGMYFVRVKDNKNTIKGSAKFIRN